MKATRLVLALLILTPTLAVLAGCSHDAKPEEIKAPAAPGGPKSPMTSAPNE